MGTPSAPEPPSTIEATSPPEPRAPTPESPTSVPSPSSLPPGTTSSGTAPSPEASPTPGPRPQPSPSPAAPGKGDPIPLNTANFEELRGNGLSVTQATQLLTDRARLGGFESVDQLGDIPGFPKDVAEDLKRRARL